MNHAADEKFTLQIQGKGLRFKARIPGWMIPAVVVYVKTAERVAERKQ